MATPLGAEGTPANKGAEELPQRTEDGTNGALVHRPVPGGHAQFLEWLLPLLVQVLVAGPLQHPPLLTSQNMTSTTKSWVDQ